MVVGAQSFLTVVAGKACGASGRRLLSDYEFMRQQYR